MSMHRGITLLRIEQAITDWHDGAGAGQALHEFLGWTWDEYARYVESDVIPERELKETDEYLERWGRVTQP